MTNKNIYMLLSVKNTAIAITFFTAFVVVSALSHGETVAHDETSPHGETVAHDVTTAEAVTIGVNGMWKPGVWTPVTGLGKESGTVAAEVAKKGPAEVAAVDDDGVWVRYPVENGCAMVRSGLMTGTLKVYRPNEKVFTCSLPKPVPSHQHVCLVLGTESQQQNILDAVSRSGTDHSQRPIVVRLDNLDNLPKDVRALDVVDQIVVFSTLTPNTKALLALWVRAGGDLIVSNTQLISESEQLINNNNRENTDLVPISLSQTTPLEEYAGADAAVPRLGIGRQFDINVGFVPFRRDSVVVCRYMNRPLIVRQAMGFGRVTTTTFDLAHDSIIAWSCRDKLYRRIMDIPETAEEVQLFSSNAILHYGYDDLPGQLASALDQFPGVPCLSFWSIAGLLMVYIALIGFVDYFIWRKLHLPPQLTWISFPIYITVFCGLFFWIAQTNKGSAIRANVVAVHDFDYQSGMSQKFSYSSVFVPKAGRYTFDLASENSQTSVPDQTSELTHLSGSVESSRWTSWFGSTGQGISGMNFPARFTPRTTDFYQEPLENHIQTMSDVPLAAWMSRNLVGCETSVGQPLPKIEYDLSDEFDKPQGKIVNNTNLVFEETLLIYGSWAFPLGTVRPGQTVLVNDQLERYSLDAILVGKRVQLTDVAEKYSNKQTPYNPISFDCTDILRTMMFYRASGGQSYTKLENGYMSPTDFSPLISLYRAVLLAKITTSGQSPTGQPGLRINSEAISPTQIDKSTSDQRLLFYRLVLPVVPIE